MRQNLLKYLRSLIMSKGMLTDPDKTIMEMRSEELYTFLTFSKSITRRKPN